MPILPVKLRPIELWAVGSDGKPRWNEHNLRERYENGERSFDRGFRQRAFSDGEGTFPGFAKCEVPGVSIGEIARGGWPRFTGVDLSSKKRPGNAIVTVAVAPDGRRYPIDVRYGAWRSSETARQIRAVDNEFRPLAIAVEDNSYQEALIDWIGEDKAAYPFWAKVEATTTTGDKKADPQKGLPGLDVELGNQAWVFPLSEYEGAHADDQDPRRGAWARLADEFRHHPIAQTSDGVMATWFARQLIIKYLPVLRAGGGSGLGDLTAR